MLGILPALLRVTRHDKPRALIPRAWRSSCPSIRIRRIQSLRPSAALCRRAAQCRPLASLPHTLDTVGQRSHRQVYQVQAWLINTYYQRKFQTILFYTYITQYSYSNYKSNSTISRLVSNLVD